MIRWMGGDEGREGLEGQGGDGQPFFVGKGRATAPKRTFHGQIFERTKF